MDARRRAGEDGLQRQGRREKVGAGLWVRTVEGDRVERFGERTVRGWVSERAVVVVGEVVRTRAREDVAQGQDANVELGARRVE